MSYNRNTINSGSYYNRLSNFNSVQHMQNSQVSNSEYEAFLGQINDLTTADGCAEFNRKIQNSTLHEDQKITLIFSAVFTALNALVEKKIFSSGNRKSLAAKAIVPESSISALRNSVARTLYDKKWCDPIYMEKAATNRVAMIAKTSHVRRTQPLPPYDFSFGTEMTTSDPGHEDPHETVLGALESVLAQSKRSGTDKSRVKDHLRKRVEALRNEGLSPADIVISVLPFQEGKRGRTRTTVLELDVNLNTYKNVIMLVRRELQEVVREKLSGKESMLGHDLAFRLNPQYDGWKR